MKTQSDTIKEDVWIPTSCGGCYGQCGIKARRVDGVITELEGNPESVAGSGKICAKGTAQLMTLYDPQEHRDLAFHYGQDPGVACRSYASWVLWLLGFPDQALEKSGEAVSLAQELDHPFSLVLALSFATWLHQFRQEMYLTYERAESALALSNEKGFGFWKGWEMIMKGWAMNGEGEDNKKIEMIRHGLDTWRASGSELGHPYFLALLAEVCGKAGQTDKGLQLLGEALQLVNSTEERWCEAELLRLKGELLLSESSENQD